MLNTYDSRVTGLASQYLSDGDLNDSDYNELFWELQAIDEMNDMTKKDSECTWYINKMLELMHDIKEYGIHYSSNADITRADDIVDIAQALEERRKDIGL